ncbi:hypothetical protein K438DRAFT_2146578 [Mycena galopus ATCC 62051]|nr:hypothetical protein K438DRAFT_2146578 [Mycena galopus ATCC 62051]
MALGRRRRQRIGATPHPPVTHNPRIRRSEEEREGVKCWRRVVPVSYRGACRAALDCGGDGRREMLRGCRRARWLGLDACLQQWRVWRASYVFGWWVASTASEQVDGRVVSTAYERMSRCWQHGWVKRGAARRSTCATQYGVGVGDSALSDRADRRHGGRGAWAQERRRGVRWHSMHGTQQVWATQRVWAIRRMCNRANRQRGCGCMGGMGMGVGEEATGQHRIACTGDINGQG